MSYSLVHLPVLRRTSLDHDLMFVQEDDIHRIVWLRIRHIVFRNQNRRYSGEAR